MNGRIYASQLGRMLSPDPVTQAPENGQNYNRYAYAFNNPLGYTDPTGYRSDDRKTVCKDDCGGGAALVNPSPGSQSAYFDSSGGITVNGASSSQAFISSSGAAALAFSGSGGSNVVVSEGAGRGIATTPTSETGDITDHLGTPGVEDPSDLGAVKAGAGTIGIVQATITFAGCYLGRAQGCSLGARIAISVGGMTSLNTIADGVTGTDWGARSLVALGVDPAIAVTLIQSLGFGSGLISPGQRAANSLLGTGGTGIGSKVDNYWDASGLTAGAIGATGDDD